MCRRVVAVDLVPLTPALEYFLNASHWLDASPSDDTASLPKLIDAVNRLVATRVGADAPMKSGEKLPNLKLASAGARVESLEGSVRRAGNRLRITVQLIHAVDGTTYGRSDTTGN